MASGEVYSTKTYFPLPPAQDVWDFSKKNYGLSLKPYKPLHPRALRSS